MIVLSHRGYWKSPEEKNAREAFARSFDLGFGTETDVRDCLGRIVIAHDMPRGDEMTFEEFLDLRGDRPRPLALNIKADGLAKPLRETLDRRGITEYFCFDMSVPDMVSQLKHGLTVFTRMSELETSPSALDRAAGVWIDGFESVWFGPKQIEAILERDKAVCIVSPELHGRDYRPLWTTLRESTVCDHPRVMICTDRPEDAEAFFQTTAKRAA